MTPEQMISLAYDCNAMPECCTDKSLIDFAQAIEAHTREECAKVVEQDLYPDDAGKPYTQQYNDSIKRLADKIRSLK